MPDDDRATPPGDDQPPALPAPGDHAGDDRLRGRATGRNYGLTRRYSPIERAGLTWLAIRDGVTATADAHGVPRSTLTTWMEEAGGIGPVQEWLRAETLQSYLKFEQALYAEATRRLEKIPNTEFGLTLRKLIEARTGLLATQGQAEQPVATAQAMVRLEVTKGEDGKVSYIDLGPVPAEEDLPPLPGE